VSVRELFDPGALRSIGHRCVFVRRVTRPILVLGSTQPAGIADGSALLASGIELVRRRSGGGAVLVEPDRSLWLDTWVPRGDRLWHDDVSRSRSWVGEWWAAAIDAPGLRVHSGPPVSSRWSELICFAGVDAGEVVDAERKAVGVAQWRSREGALTHSFAYIDPAWQRLSELLLPAGEATEAALELAASTVALGELTGLGAAELVDRLLALLPEPEGWDVRPG
jgi:lipoate-protein ligase A